MVGEEDSLNLLLCHESESSFNDDDDFKRSEQQEQEQQHCFVPSTIGQDDEDYVAELVRKENLRFGNEEPIKTTSSSSFDRLIAINWILTTRTRFGFQHQTAYIAISYFDLFLKKRFIGKDETWAIRLLSVACLSLAAKMEERNVPGLSQYPQDQDFVFKPDVIRKTELLILSTLDWKLNLITPFHYFNYFIPKIGQEQQNQSLVLLRSSESLLALTKEMSFTDYRQFIVAAATTLLVSSTSSSVIRLTRDEMSDKFSSISWWTSNDNDNVYSCYQRMLEIEDKKHIMTPPPETSGDVKPGGSASGSAAKRRLSFDDDQISPSRKMRRL